VLIDAEALIKTESWADTLSSKRAVLRGNESAREGRVDPSDLGRGNARADRLSVHRRCDGGPGERFGNVVEWR
jgi:hypothetical protein